MGSKWLLRTWVTFLMAREQGKGCRLHVPGVSGECGEGNVCPGLPSSSRMWRNWCGSIGQASGWSRARSMSWRREVVGDGLAQSGEELAAISPWPLTI